MDFLITHQPGCSPLKPCTSCVVALFLRGKLSKVDYAELVAMIQNRLPESRNCPVSLETTVDELSPFSTRIALALRELKCNTLGDIVKHSASDFLRLPNFCRKSFKELIELLDKNGCKLASLD